MPIRMSGERLRVVTPVCLMTSGSSGMARLTRFCTSTWAMFRSTPWLERDGQVVGAVVGALRGHVHHALDAVDLLLDGRGDRVGDVLGAGAGIVAGDLHRRRRDRRKLRQRQREDGDAPGQRDDDRQHRGEDRPIDEETREHSGSRKKDRQRAPALTYGFLPILGRRCVVLLAAGAAASTASPKR